LSDPTLDADLGSVVGAEIRRLRDAAGLSTRELAAAAGMSQPFLSQIERGASAPSMASVYRLARALGVRPGDLLPAVGADEVDVVRADEGRRIPVAERDDAALGRALLLRESSALEVVEYTFGPDEYIAEWFESPGESGLYLVSGRLEVDVLGAGTYALEPGDFIRFPRAPAIAGVSSARNGSSPSSSRASRAPADPRRRGALARLPGTAALPAHHRVASHVRRCHTNAQMRLSRTVADAEKCRASGRRRHRSRADTGVRGCGTAHSGGQQHPIIVLKYINQLPCVYVLWCAVRVEQDAGLEAAAALFKVLGSASRLRLVRLLATEPAGVTHLVASTGMSQPLVSQHLRTLRSAGIVTVARAGREALYSISDDHIAHVVDDALTHVLEEDPTHRGEER